MRARHREPGGAGGARAPGARAEGRGGRTAPGAHRPAAPHRTAPHARAQPASLRREASAGRARHASASLLKSERPGPPHTHLHLHLRKLGLATPPHPPRWRLPLPPHPVVTRSRKAPLLRPAPCARQLTTPAPQRHVGDPSSPPRVEGQGTQLPGAHPAKVQQSSGTQRGALHPPSASLKPPPAGPLLIATHTRGMCPPVACSFAHSCHKRAEDGN